MQTPNLGRQTGRVPRCLSAAGRLRLGERGAGRRLNGLLTQQQLPDTEGTVRGLSPPGAAGGSRPLPPLNLSRSVLPKAARQPREPAILPHLEVMLLNLTVWALEAGQRLCPSPSLRALLDPLKCQPGISLLIGVSKIDLGLAGKEMAK